MMVDDICDIWDTYCQSNCTNCKVQDILHTSAVSWDLNLLIVLKSGKIKCGG